MHSVLLYMVCVALRFKAKLYTCPDLLHDREDMMNGVNTRLEDLKTVSTSSVSVQAGDYY